MSKETLAKVVLDCIDDLRTHEMSESQALLMIGFVAPGTPIVFRDEKWETPNTKRRSEGPPFSTHCK